MVARQRLPRLARPYRRVIFVEAPVSSMKTRRCGSRSGRASSQVSRRAATSGLSCSAARAGFFEGHGVAIQEPPHRARCERGPVLSTQQLGDLGERDVDLIVDSLQDDVAIAFDLMRTAIATL